MTVALVLLFLISCLIADFIVEKYRARKHVDQEIYIHNWGLTMADGGEKLDKNKK